MVLLNPAPGNPSTLKDDAVTFETPVTPRNSAALFRWPVPHWTTQSRSERLGESKTRVVRPRLVRTKSERDRQLAWPSSELRLLRLP